MSTLECCNDHFHLLCYVFARYIKVRGIPQGSILSPLLCNMYYGHLERKVLMETEFAPKLKLDESTLVIRLMDDYLVISTDMTAVQTFLTTGWPLLSTVLHALHALSPQYSPVNTLKYKFIFLLFPVHSEFKAHGASINPLKSKANFECQVQLPDGSLESIPRILDETLPWCGMLIDTMTLETSPDFSRVLEKRISASTKIDCSSRWEPDFDIYWYYLHIFHYILCNILTLSTKHSGFNLSCFILLFVVLSISNY